ncbi:hypothetical protein [Streptomyces sp. NPDC006274]|uniref:hypothetical protein n=1 Tax=unclassified Streptomyces TaxID=2593676 RepID=UPI0033AB3BA8
MIEVTRVLGIGAATAGLLTGFALPATGAQSPSAPSAAPGAGGHAAAPATHAEGAATLGALGRRAALRIGTAVDTSALADDSTYRETVAREFSAVTAERTPSGGRSPRSRSTATGRAR